MITEATSGGEEAAVGRTDENPDDTTKGIDHPCTRPHVIDRVHRQMCIRMNGVGISLHPTIIANLHIEDGIGLDHLRGRGIRLSEYIIQPRLIILITLHINEEINLDHQSGHLRLGYTETVEATDLYLRVGSMDDLVRGQLVPPEEIPFDGTLLLVTTDGHIRCPPGGIVIVIMEMGTLSMTETMLGVAITGME